MAHSTMPMVRRAITLLGALSLTVLMTASAEAACGDFYRVKSGDTLQRIAVRQLHNGDFQAIYHANGDILRDPALIEVGQLLYLPCADRPKTRRAALADAGTRPTRRDDLGDRLALTTDPIATAEIPARATDVGAGAPGTALKVLTVAGLAPLADRGLASNGIALLIVGEALKAASDPRAIQPVFIDDWKSHLQVPAPADTYSLALPWPRPDCANPALSSASRRLCDDFLFSKPFFEMPVATLIPADSPLTDARTISALAGRTICRSEAFPPADLEKLSMDLRVIGAETAVECARLVAGGKADAISIPEPAAQRLLARAEFAKALTKARNLGRLVPVHAVARRADPGAEALIGKIDEGLQRIQLSGRWFEVVSTYLRQYNRLSASQ